ncbi:hypothetical protein [Methylobacterium sp. Gmos1]
MTDHLSTSKAATWPKVHLVSREILPNEEDAGNADWRGDRTLLARTANRAILLFQTSSYHDTSKPRGTKNLVPAALWLSTPGGVKKLAEGRITPITLHNYRTDIEQAFSFPGLVERLDFNRTGIVLGS